MINFRFILVFHGGDYMRKQNKPITTNATDEFNLIDERWSAIVQRQILLRSKKKKDFLSSTL